MPNKTGDFLPLQLTNAGRDMLTQGRAGHVLTFTKVAIGDGTATGTAIDNLTALNGHKLYIPIAKNDTVHAGQMRLQFRVNNKVVTSGFYFREIGLIAKVDNGEEKLYAYTTCGDKARMIYDNTYPIQERVVNIDTVTDNAPNVRVILDWSIVYATQKDIIDMIKPHKELSELDHPDESVTTRKLKDKSVTLPKLADDVNDLLQKTYVKKSGDTMTGNLTLTNNSELFIAAAGGNHSISNTSNNLNLGNPAITKESNLCSKNRPNWDNGTDKKLIALEEDVINETRKYLPLIGGNLTGDLMIKDKEVGRLFCNKLPRLTPLIDWDKMSIVRNNTNKTTFKTTRNGETVQVICPNWCLFSQSMGTIYFESGDIYLKEEFTSYDKLLVVTLGSNNHQSIRCNIIDCGILEWYMNNLPIVPLTGSTPVSNGYWGLYPFKLWGTNTKTSTTKLLSCWVETTDMIEIYGVKY